MHFASRENLALYNTYFYLKHFLVSFVFFEILQHFFKRTIHSQNSQNLKPCILGFAVRSISRKVKKKGEKGSYNHVFP